MRFPLNCFSQTSSSAGSIPFPVLPSPKSSSWGPAENDVRNPSISFAEDSAAESPDFNPVPHANSAPGAPRPWHHMPSAPHADMQPYSRVRGELRVPNTLNFSLFPSLDPYSRTVYYQLFLFSRGFHKDTCSISLKRLSESSRMSVRKVQKSIVYLESMGLVKRLRPGSRGRWKLSSYQVTVPGESPLAATAKTGEENAPSPIGKTVDRTTQSAEINPAPRANIKRDDDQEKKSSSKSGNAAFPVNTPENHSPAAAPQEREPYPAEILEKVRSAYEKATGNIWYHSDEIAFRQNELDRIPLPRILATMESVVQRTPAKVNSFKYFIREIKASQDT